MNISHTSCLSWTNVGIWLGFARQRWTNVSGLGYGKILFPAIIITKITTNKGVLKSLTTFTILTRTANYQNIFYLKSKCLNETFSSFNYFHSIRRFYMYIGQTFVQRKPYFNPNTNLISCLLLVWSKFGMLSGMAIKDGLYRTFFSNQSGFKLWNVGEDWGDEKIMWTPFDINNINFHLASFWPG